MHLLSFWKYLKMGNPPFPKEFIPVVHHHHCSTSISGQIHQWTWSYFNFQPLFLAGPASKRVKPLLAPVFPLWTCSHMVTNSLLSLLLINQTDWVLYVSQCNVFSPNFKSCKNFFNTIFSTGFFQTWTWELYCSIDLLWKQTKAYLLSGTCDSFPTSHALS